MIEWIHNIRIIVCLLAVGLMMPQHALALEDIQYSQAFSFSNGMKCKSSPTISNEFTRNVHFHMIVGAEHNEVSTIHFQRFPRPSGRDLTHFYTLLNINVDRLAHCWPIDYAMHSRWVSTPLTCTSSFNERTSRVTGGTFLWNAQFAMLVFRLRMNGWVALTLMRKWARAMRCSPISRN